MKADKIRHTLARNATGWTAAAVTLSGPIVLTLNYLNPSWGNLGPLGIGVSMAGAGLLICHEIAQGR
jgi:hypothetical protein